MVYVKYSTSDPTSKIARGRKSKSGIFALFDGGIPLVLQGGGYTIKMSKGRKIAFLIFPTSGDLGEWIWGPSRKRLLNKFWFVVSWSLKNASFCDFFRNSQNKLTASEAAEAGLGWPWISALMNEGCMQSPSAEAEAVAREPRNVYLGNIWV